MAIAAFTLGACGPQRDQDSMPPAPNAATEDRRGAFPRTVRHAMGETVIPAPPQRLVVLDTGELDSVTAFGLTAVGAVRAPVDDGLLGYLEPKAAGTQLVGTITEPNLEQVAALRPDLILSSRIRHEALYPKLSQIAPTVFTETVGVVWKENLRVHAEALGFESRAERMLADYEARAVEVGRRAAAGGPPPTISVVRFLAGEIRLYQKASFIGTILSDARLPRPSAQDVDGFRLSISPEQVELADGDVIVVTTYGAADETTKPAITTNPVWSQLSAVRAGRVYEMDDDHWMTGIGIQAANRVLDDIERRNFFRR